MNIFKIISNIILIGSAILNIYILVDLFISKSKLKKGKIKCVNNVKYICNITIIVVLFVIHGILRNFI